MRTGASASEFVPTLTPCSVDSFEHYREFKAARFASIRRKDGLETRAERRKVASSCVEGCAGAGESGRKFADVLPVECMTLCEYEVQFFPTLLVVSGC